jgi:hypothetical protein
MQNRIKIKNFWNWKIPSGEGVTYLEGVPTEEERRLNIRRTAAERKVWQPNQEAIAIYNQLKLFEGKRIKVQIWNELMTLLPEEGPYPFICELIQVYTKTLQEKDRKFLQLFIEFKNPQIIKKGSLGDNPIYPEMLDPITGTYTYNCSNFFWIKEGV